MRCGNGAFKVASGTDDPRCQTAQWGKVSRMIGSDELKQRLRELAEMSPHAASVATARRLLETFRARRRRKRVWTYWGAAAASLVIGSLSYVLWQEHERNVAVAAESSYVSAPGFLPLPYAQSDVPLEHAVVVRVSIPRAEASAWGVPLDPGGRARVSADLLIGQDGMARAVRFVP